jgi:hypothetical protein
MQVNDKLKSNYHKYLKYKSKYISLKNNHDKINYMNESEIKLVKERIQFLTHMGTYIFILIHFAARNILKMKNMHHMLLRVLFMEATLP